MTSILTRRAFMRQIFILPFAWMQTTKNNSNLICLGDRVLYRGLSLMNFEDKYKYIWYHEVRDIDVSLYYENQLYLGGTKVYSCLDDEEKFYLSSYHFSECDDDLYGCAFLKENAKRFDEILNSDHSSPYQFVRKISRNQEMSKIPEIAFELNGGIHFATKAEKREIRERNQK